MDHHRFDTLTRSLTTTGSRRRALTVALSGAFGVLGLVPADDAAAAKKCPPCKKRKQGKCKKTLPDGTACSGGTCQGGSCVRTPSPPSSRCTPECSGKTCGDDGCDGFCGSCTAPETCHGGTCCRPDCNGKDCGDDGCGGSCGPCTGGTCQDQDGVCACPQDKCGGVCQVPCSEVRNPFTCACCLSNATSCDLNPAYTQCCSGMCSYVSGSHRCVDKAAGQGCTFGAQCVSKNCQDNGPGAGTCA